MELLFQHARGYIIVVTIIKIADHADFWGCGYDVIS